VRTVRPPEHEVERVGRELLRAARPSWRDRVNANTRLLAWATRRPHFKSGLFRFVDAFPACRSAREVLDHLDEYVRTDDAPAFVRAGIRGADVLPGGASIAAVVARAGIERMARQFIGGASALEGVARVAELWGVGFASTVDLLGEKTLTLADADVYAARARETLDALVAAAPAWPSQPLLERDPWGGLPRVNISIKASALAPLLAPATVREGIAEALERLAPLLERGVRRA